VAIHGVRVYDAGMVSWTTPDQSAGSPYDPQSLQRYTYVDNNPMNFQDPTGRYVVGDGGWGYGAPYDDPGAYSYPDAEWFNVDGGPSNFGGGKAVLKVIGKVTVRAKLDVTPHLSCAATGVPMNPIGPELYSQVNDVGKARGWDPIAAWHFVGHGGVFDVQRWGPPPGFVPGTSFSSLWTPTGNFIAGEYAASAGLTREMTFVAFLGVTVGVDHNPSLLVPDVSMGFAGFNWETANCQ